MIDTNEARFNQHAARHQARAAEAYGFHGMAPPPRISGESVDDFRRRLLSPLMRYSKRWQNVKAETVGETILPILEEQVFADAVEAIRGDATGPLREVVTKDQAGRSIHKFYGSSADTWAPFQQPSRIVTGWNTKA